MTKKEREERFATNFPQLSEESKEHVVTVINALNMAQRRGLETDKAEKTSAEDRAAKRRETA